MLWGYGESKLRCVSGAKPPFALLCFDKPPGSPPGLRARRLCRVARCQAIALTAGTLCRLVRRLSPELSERERRADPRLLLRERIFPVPRHVLGARTFIPARATCSNPLRMRIVGEPRVCSY